MDTQRQSSLDSITFPNWRWKFFLDYAIDQLCFLKLKPYPIQDEFLDKEVDIGAKGKSLFAMTSTWACKTNKIRQARAVCLEAPGIASVLNFVITPSPQYDLPFLVLIL